MHKQCVHVLQAHDVTDGLGLLEDVVVAKWVRRPRLGHVVDLLLRHLGGLKGAARGLLVVVARRVVYAPPAQVQPLAYGLLGDAAVVADVPPALGEPYPPVPRPITGH